MSLRLATFLIAGNLLMGLPVLSAEYWYGTSGAIPLRIDSTKVTLQIADGFSQNQVLENFGRVLQVLDNVELIDDFVCCSLSTGNGYDQFMDSLDQVPGVLLVEPYYLTSDSFPFPVGEGFVNISLVIVCQT